MLSCYHRQKTEGGMEGRGREVGRGREKNNEERERERGGGDLFSHRLALTHKHIQIENKLKSKV